jgi:hypothetical protein
MSCNNLLSNAYSSRIAMRRAWARPKAKKIRCNQFPFPGKCAEALFSIVAIKYLQNK